MDCGDNLEELQIADFRTCPERSRGIADLEERDKRAGEGGRGIENESLNRDAYAITFTYGAVFQLYLCDQGPVA